MEPGGGQLGIIVDTCDAPHGLTAFLRISNNGPAIDELHKENIFDPFYSESGGTGLGLSISLGIVENHGGILTAECEPGRGSTFRISIPVSGTES
jgi:two-component system NtrC family sensor kinase